MNTLIETRQKHTPQYQIFLLTNAYLKSLNWSYFFKV